MINQDLMFRIKDKFSYLAVIIITLLADIKSAASTGIILELPAVIFSMLHSAFIIMIILNKDKLKTIFIDHGCVFSENHSQKMGLTKNILLIASTVFFFNRFVIFSSVLTTILIRDFIIMRCMMYLAFLDDKEKGII